VQWDRAREAQRRLSMEEIKVDKGENMGGKGRRIGRNLA
jgi:hypothetical protein